MADYYPLLAKAIAGLEANTPESRFAIYDRARSALLRQLAGIDPPVAQAIVDREVGALETVFIRLEQENAVAVPDVPVAVQPPEPEVAPVLRVPDALKAPPVPSLSSTGKRPRVKAAKAADDKNRKPLIAVGLAVGAVVVGTLATLAFLRRDEPPAVATRGLQTAQPAAPATANPVAPKASDRVGAGSDTAPVQPAVPAQPATPVQPTAQPASPAPAQTPAQPPAIGVANRAILLLQATEKDQPILERQGSVVWRSDLVSAGQGQPSDRMIRGLIDVPDARLQVELTIQRNRDVAFPASHTVQVRSIPSAGSEVPVIHGVTTMEFRQSQEQTGYALAGQGIAVVDNLFLIALSQAEPARSRNEEMMKARPLVYFEFSMGGERRGAILMDKGISGQQAFDQAFASWQ